MAVKKFLLPDLGEGLEDAEVVTWRVAEGDRVELNQTLVEVNTAKALVEVPSPWEGVVDKLYASEGDVVKVGQPLVSIRLEEGAAEGGEVAGGEGQEPGPRRRPVLVGYGVEEEETASPPPAKKAAAGARQGPVRASPPVRRLARELGIDLSVVQGTGPGGRVTREDLMRTSEVAAQPTAAGDERAVGERAGPEDVREIIAVKGTRRLIAEKMARSAREIPHVTTFLTVDAFHLQAFREDIATEGGERVSPLPIVVRALVEVCMEHPKLNSSFDHDGSQIVVHGRCHVGIATDTERGLLVPVIHDADRKGIVEISREIETLGEAARSGTAKPQDLTGGTITVTNVGTFGAEFGTPIINHPEAAILALGVIEPRALVVGGEVQARPAVTLSLSFDHRVLDGAEAGRALKALGDLLESPFRLGALPR